MFPAPTSQADSIPSSIERRLLAHPDVIDCAVHSWRDEQIAWVVTPGLVEDVKGKLEGSLREAGLPVLPLVFVVRIPRAGDGSLDLSSPVAVLDDEVVQRWHQTLSAQHEGRPLVVLVREDAAAPLGSLNLSLGDEPRPVTSSVEAPAREQATAPSLADGGPLPVVADAPTTLADALRQTARLWPTHRVIHLGSDGVERSQTYSELLAEARRVAAGLRAAGHAPGRRVLILLDHSHDIVPTFWGCLVGGYPALTLAVPPVFRPEQQTVDRLLHAWQRLERPVFVSSGATRQALLELGAQLGLPFEALDLQDLRQTPDPGEDPPVHPDDTALFFLTSGSTGKPKVVPQRHSNLCAHALSSGRRRGQTPHETTLNWMPLDHVGSCVMFGLTDTYTGSTQIHGATASVLANPLLWLDWIDRFRVNITWSPNFAYSLIVERASQISAGRWDLRCMRFFLNGGEAVMPRTGRRFLQLLAPHGLPPDALHPAYGMSEICSAITYSDGFRLDAIHDDDQFVEVGPPNPGVRLRIVNDAGEVVPEGQTGSLEVQGPVVTTGYLAQPEANAEAFSPDGWFRTGDVALLRKGVLTITGRAKEVVVVNGVKFPCHDIEIVAEDVAGVDPSYTAAFPVRKRDGATEQLAIFFHTSVEPRDWPALLARIAGEVTRRIGLAPSFLLPIQKDDLPRTSIGKIERATLRRRFEAGDYEERLREIEAMVGRGARLPDAFFARTWTAAPLAPLHASVQGPVLVIGDRSPLRKALVVALRAQGERVIEVVPGSVFARLSGDEFSLGPSTSASFERLFGQLGSEGVVPHHVVHLGAQDPDAFPETRLLLNSVVSLVHHLPTARDSLRLLLVTRGACALDPVEETSPRLGVLAGLVRTVSQEIRWIDGRVVDLDPVPPSAEQEAAHLIDELRTAHRDREVAWRQGQRAAPALQHLAMAALPTGPSPLRPGGLYVVAGGLGGVGSVVTAYLLEHFQARVLVLGRTILQEDGGRELEPTDARTLERLQTLRRLRTLGGEVRYASVDITDLANLELTVRDACAFWKKPLDGVIHAAGVSRERFLVDEGSEEFSASLRPWIDGVANLLSVVEPLPDPFVLVNSFASAQFGGAGISTYSAAGGYLELVIQQRRARGAQRSFCLCWSQWDEVGMNRKHPARELARARGYLPLTTGQALDSLRAVLARGLACTFVGLDPTNKFVRALMRGEHGSSVGLTAFVEGSGEPASAPVTGPVLDRFGTPTSCKVRFLEKLPRTPDGQIDPVPLRRMRHETQAVQAVEPRSEQEAALLALWSDVLGSPPLSREESFFAAGGDSLRAAQFVGRLREVLGVELSLHQLFDSPAFEAIAQAMAVPTQTAVAPIPRQQRDRFKATSSPRGSVKLPDELRQRLAAARGKTPEK